MSTVHKTAQRDRRMYGQSTTALYKDVYAGCKDDRGCSVCHAEKTTHIAQQSVEQFSILAADLIGPFFSQQSKQIPEPGCALQQHPAIMLSSLPVSMRICAAPLQKPEKMRFKSLRVRTNSSDSLRHGRRSRKHTEHPWRACPRSSYF